MNPDVAAAAVSRETAVLAALRVVNKAMQLDGTFFEEVPRTQGGLTEQCAFSHRPSHSPKARICKGW